MRMKPKPIIPWNQSLRVLGILLAMWVCQRVPFAGRDRSQAQGRFSSRGTCGQGTVPRWWR